MRRGVTLTEILVTLALLSLALAILATLMRSASRLILHSERKDAEVRSALAVCQQVRQDLESAISVSAPAVGATSSTVTLVRMNPFESNLQYPLLPSTSAWSPHPANLQWTVSFSLTGDRVMRSVTPGSGTAWTSEVASGILLFECTVQGDSGGHPVAALVHVDTGSPVKRSLLEFPLHVPRQVVP